jgi:ribosomal protein S27AE
MAPAINRIIKRPMTDMERVLVTKNFQSLQKPLRMIAPIPIVLFLISYLAPTTDEVMSLFITFITITLCIVVIGMSIGVIQYRKKMSAVLRDGTAIEVHGLAFRNQTAKRNLQSFTVGPISMSMGLKDSSIIPEGAQVIVLCIPKLKTILLVNNKELVHGASITCPPNLEAMAELANLASQQPMAQQSQVAYSQQYPQPHQEQPTPYQQPPTYPTPLPSQPAQYSSVQSNQPQMQQPQAHRSMKTCPTCGVEMEYVQQYSRWYCRKCQRYPKLQELYPPPPPPNP